MLGRETGRVNDQRVLPGGGGGEVRALPFLSIVDPPVHAERREQRAHAIAAHAAAEDRDGLREERLQKTGGGQAHLSRKYSADGRATVRPVVARSAARPTYA